MAVPISILSALLSSPTTCRWGNGEPAEQPTNQTMLSCTPAAAAGAGQVDVELELQDGAGYADATLFTYAPKVEKGRGLVTVAGLAYGADGGCAGHGFRPSNASERDALILSYLHHAGQLGVDLAILPENAFGRPGMPGGCSHEAEPIDGPTVQRVAAIASRYEMNVVLPIHESRKGKFFNTAVVLDRQGRTVGTYSKIFPVYGNSSSPPQSGEIDAPNAVWPSSGGVRAFDLDFGRIAVLICFDINFGELWLQAEALGADLLVWPSAMATPDPSSYGYARIHQFDIVAVGYPADFVGRDGARLDRTVDGDFPLMARAMIDLDRTFVHWDYNRAKVERLLADHPEVVVDAPGPPFYLLRSNDTGRVDAPAGGGDGGGRAGGTSVRALCRAYGIETNREYVHRSRRGLNRMRTTGLPPWEGSALGARLL